MSKVNKMFEGIKIEELDVSNMISTDAMTEEDSNQIMGASCTTCTCTCSCCTT